MRERERKKEEEDGMNGAKESRGKHRVKIERAKELLDLETEIQRCIYRDRVKGGKEKAGRKSFSREIQAR